MAAQELLDLNFTSQLEAVKKEILLSINIPITAATNEIQLKMHRVTLFINTNPKEKPYLDLLGNLMRFMKIQDFPDMIRNAFNECLKQVDTEIKAKVEKMMNTGIFTRFPPDKKDKLKPYFLDSTLNPLDEHLITFKNLILDFISFMREDLKSSIDGISFELKALSDEVKKTISLIDDLSGENNLELLTESLLCWREDINDLENYWKRKIYMCETVLSEKLDYINIELNKLIQIVIKCLKE